MAIAALAPAVLPSPAAAQAPLALEGIVVTANRRPTPVEQVGSAISVITREQLQRRQIQLVSEALRTLPGLSVARSGGAGALTEVRIRGAEANQTLVLIDGIEVNDPSLGSTFDLSGLLTNDIERIEVLRGPQSVLYGSDAVGGVINIVTLRGDGITRGHAGAEAGGHGTGSGHVGLGGSLVEGRIRYRVDGAAYRTGGISAADEHDGNGERDGLADRSASASIQADLLDNLGLDLVGRVADLDRQGDAYVGGIGAIDAQEDGRLRQLLGRADLKLGLLDDRWQQRLGLAAADQRSDYRSDDALTSSYDGLKTKIDYQSDLTLESRLPLPALHVLTLGAEQEREHAASDSAFSTFDESTTNRSLFGLYQLTLLDSLTLTAGGRLDANDRFEDARTWRLTAAYDLAAPGTRLRASLGTAVQNPSLFELFGYTESFVPNPDLRPEKALGWDVGIDQSLLDDRLRLGATWFAQRLEDYIAFTGDTVTNLDGQSKIHGLELEVAFDILPSLTIGAGYTFTDAEGPDGDELVRRPRHQASATLGYRFFDERATADLTLRHVGAQDDYFYDAAYDQQTVRLDPYTVLDLALAWRLQAGVRLYGRIENLLGDHYQEVYSYGAPGRSAYAGVALTF